MSSINDNFEIFDNGDTEVYAYTGNHPHLKMAFGIIVDTLDNGMVLFRPWNSRHVPSEDVYRVYKANLERA